MAACGSALSLSRKRLGPVCTDVPNKRRLPENPVTPPTARTSYTEVKWTVPHMQLPAPQPPKAFVPSAPLALHADDEGIHTLLGAGPSVPELNLFAALRTPSAPEQTGLYPDDEVMHAPVTPEKPYLDV